MNNITRTYLLLMFGLITSFFALLVFLPNSGQSALWFAHLQDYMADILNPAIVSMSNDPYNIIPNDKIEYFYYGALLTDGDRSYPPLSYLLFRMLVPLFSFAPKADLLFCHYIMMVGAVFYVLVLFNNMKGNNTLKTLIILSFLFSGIFMFTWERGNNILHTALLMAFFIFYYKSQNKYIRELALIFLCVAVNLKITPVILGLFLLQEKRYWDIGRCVIYCSLMFFLPLLCFEGSIGEQISKFIENNRLFSEATYRRGYPELSFVAFGVNREILLNIYSYISLFLSLFAVITFFFQKTAWKKVALLLICIYTSSSLSGIYVFIYFLIFITMFLSQSSYVKKDYIYMFLIVMMLNPLQIYVGGFNISHDLLLLAMMIMMLMLVCEGIVPMVDWILSKIEKFKSQENA